MINDSKKDITLDCIFYIYYLVYFQKCNKYINLLINLNNKINIITPTYILKLGF